ncbi:protein SON isoform X2 [Scleropages formosus]|uniref:SON DNA and RNA binding protein a n=1 Tax=Scleropages formosus TaxID=113540 RepID=A0A8C9RX80_SCLFO|nr:protein SON isoform X2 [Scleropages formosus]
MATNIEQIFRDFVMNKIREIEDEGQHSGVTGEGRSNGGVPTPPAKTGPGQEVAAAMECHGDAEETMESAGKPRLEDAGALENAATAEATPGKEGSETPRKKNKKHKRHKSKKKKKKRKEEKESSSESGMESGGEAPVRVKTQGQSSKERAAEGEEGAAAQEPAGNVPAAGQPMEEGDGKTKKHKRHMAKKKKKKKKKEEEKQEKKSPSRSRSESTSASGSESDSELRPPSKLPPASFPVVALGKDRESTSPAVPSQELQKRMSPMTSGQDVEPVKGNSVCAQGSGEGFTAKSGETCLAATEEKGKVTSSMPLEVASEPNDDQGNFSTKQDLPDIIPKLENTHKEEPPAKADDDMPADGKGNQEAGHEMKRQSYSASRSKSRSRSPSKLTSTVPLRAPLQKSHSRSQSQKRSTDKQGSRKARSLSKRRSRSTSKRRSSPRKKRSRSRSGRRRSRSPSLKRSGRKSRSLSTRRRRRSDSRSRTRNRRSRSRSRRRTRSRSIVRRRRSRSRSLSRRRRSRSRSKRSRSRRRTQRSRSARRGRRSRSRSRRRRSVSRSRRSRSRSVRRTRRTRSRSIVILRRSRSRSLLRRNRRSRSRSLRRRSRSIKRHRSKSRSLRRSRRSRSRSPARRRRSKTSSPRRSRRSKSHSPIRHHRSRSDSHKGGRKQSQSPKKNRHSKSRSPTRIKSKSRSVSRDVQSCEKSLVPPQEKGASKSGTPAREWCDADLPLAEVQEKDQSPEQPGQDDGPSGDVGPQMLNVEECTMIEETPTESRVDGDGADGTVLASVGAWRPVPFLEDSGVSSEADPVAEGVNNSPSAEEATVRELPEECKSPKTKQIEKCFTPEMPLTAQDLHSDSPSQAISKPRVPESTEHVENAPEDMEHLTEFRSGSISPQSQRPCESICVEPEESDVASCEALKLEPRVTCPSGRRRTRSRSADQDCSEIDRKSERSRSHSVSKEGQTPTGKLDSESRSPSISKKESLSNQARLSASPGARKRSTSMSPSRRKKSKSKSPARGKHSRSSSSSQRRRSQSKSASRKKKSKSKSPSRKKKSRSRSRSRKRKSKSPARRRRSRSKSTTKRRKSRSKSTSRSTKRKRSKSRSPVRKKRSKSRSPRRSKRSKSRSPARRKRSKSAEKSKRSKSRSPTRKRRSRSRSANRARRSRSRRSRSLSRRRRGGFRSRSFDRRDRWRREPSHSPILILRKKRSASRTRRSASKTPPRLTELDKDQLLEIAKANAAAMCAKAGMPIPESLRPKAILQLPLPTPVPSPLNLPLPLPMNLPMGMPMGMPNISMNAAMATMTAATMTAALTNMGALGSMPAMPALPSITNKPPPTAMPNTANIEEVKRKVTQKANSISIKELTEKCKMIAESKEEMAVAQPHVSDDEEEEKPFGGGALRENKGISFSLSNPSAKPATRTEAAFAKEFPVSSGSQHRRKENEGAYGEWVPVDRKMDKDKAAASSSAGAVAEEEGKQSDSVFPDAPLQPVDITLAVSERAVAQKRLAENPFDVNAICMLSRAQEQVDAWAQSNSIPGLFTGSTGAQVLSSEELSSSGPQAWVKKDQFLKAAPVSGGVGEFLMRKMGWRAGEGLGKYREGTVEPIVIDFKTDRKGLVAEGEKMQKSGSLVVMKDLLGKHPVSALMEICNKKKWAPPEFVMVHHSGPDHRKNFLFKVVVNGTDYQPQTASPNKKHAKAMAATVALQAMGEVSGDSLHSGPVFTAATSTD